MRDPRSMVIYTRPCFCLADCKAGKDVSTTMDAFNLLKTDHQKVAQLFDELESANGKAKLQVFAQIKTELELHTHIEETIFYPALEKLEETHHLTLEAYEEHKMVKNLL